VEYILSFLDWTDMARMSSVDHFFRTAVRGHALYKLYQKRVQKWNFVLSKGREYAAENPKKVTYCHPLLIFTDEISY
jgi:hypothetical protein